MKNEQNEHGFEPGARPVVVSRCPPNLQAQGTNRHVDSAQQEHTSHVNIGYTQRTVPLAAESPTAQPEQEKLTPEDSGFAADDNVVGIGCNTQHTHTSDDRIRDKRQHKLQHPTCLDFRDCLSKPILHAQSTFTQCRQANKANETRAQANGRPA